MFDHWAHLSGAAFGVAYYTYGPQFWDYMRAINGGSAPAIYPAPEDVDT
jgi:hypothetical protein